MPEIVRLSFLGDLMVGRGVSRKLRDHPPEWFWGDALPILRQADAVIANLESPITASGRRWRQSWKMFHFKASPDAVGILTTGNVRFVCLANNHILDYGERGLLDTIEALERCGIGHAGAGRNIAEASASRTLDLPGMKVGLMAATDNMRDFGATPNDPGTNYLEFHTDSPAIDWIERSVSHLRRAGADLIVLSVHWGPNMRVAPNLECRRFAHAAIERGVDVIHGHSAHVVQAIEHYRHGVIFYDAGNFIDDYWKFPFRHTIWSFVFTLVVENGRPARLRLVPILIHASPLGIATGDVFEAIIKDVKLSCAPFGTPLVETAEGLELALA